MDAPLHSREKGTVGFRRQTCCEKEADSEIDRHGGTYECIYIEYLEKRKTTSREYYMSLLHRWSDKIRKKASSFETEKNPFPSRSARVCTKTTEL